jgi:hypothetical protein
LVGSAVCCVQPFGEEGYGKDQVTKDFQQRVGKEWIRIWKEHLYRKVEKLGECFVISLRHSMSGAGSLMICCYIDCLSDAVVGCDAVLGG